jgi:hypothetical protein
MRQPPHGAHTADATIGVDSKGAGQGRAGEINRSEFAGEVYLARDTHLDRRVALKILPEAFATDAERMRRYTELPGVAHNAWDPAYSRADVFEWLLKQKAR